MYKFLPYFHTVFIIYNYKIGPSIIIKSILKIYLCHNINNILLMAIFPIGFFHKSTY